MKFGWCVRFLSLISAVTFLAQLHSPSQSQEGTIVSVQNVMWRRRLTNRLANTDRTPLHPTIMSTLLQCG